MSLIVGRVLDGRYRLAEILGQGATGAVYRAECLGEARQVAVKVLHDELVDEPDLKERFEREARALFALRHPHILGVLDYGVTSGGTPYLVMELLEGQNLAERIDERPLSPEVALEVAEQFLSGLSFAHQQAILHRDLKTENIFLERTEDGRPRAKLLDFGLVKFVDDERWGSAKKLTLAGSVMGSPAYMSPEQGTGGHMDARSDVYSAGVVVYELLTGSWPFMEENRTEMLKAHLLRPVPKLGEVRGSLRAAPELDAWMARAMAKDPAARFANGEEMLATWRALPRPQAWLQGSATEPPQRHPPSTSRRLTWAALGLGILGLGVLGLGILGLGTVLYGLWVGPPD